MLSLCQHIWKFHPGRARLSVQTKWGGLPSHATSSYKDTKTKTRGKKTQSEVIRRERAMVYGHHMFNVGFFFSFHLNSNEKSMLRHS